MSGAGEKTIRKKASLQFRMTGYLFIFVAIIIAALWAIYSLFLDDIYMSVKIKDIYKYSGSLTSQIDTETLASDADILAKNERICIFIFNITTVGDIISCEGLQNKCDLHKAFYGFSSDSALNYNNIFGLVERARENDGSILLRVSSHGIRFDKDELSSDLTRSDSEQSVILAKIVKNNNGDEFLVVVNSIITPMASTVSTLNSLLVYISLFLGGLAVIFAFVISYVVSKPLSKITASAKELAKGNYSETFSGEGYSEVIELADTLNYASSELSKVDKLKNELLANISHDLRTPLSLISGYAEMMQDLPSEMTAENLQIIVDESERMKSLVNDVLDISKLQSGNVIYNMKPFNLTQCIRGEMARYNKLREKEGFKIDFNANEEVSVNGDATRLMQALYNLVNNAATHTGNDKSVMIEQSTNNERVRISVSDTGNGIEAKDLALIWERYYKVDKYLKRAYTGSGLGLSIVKTIIEAHKGVCGVDSALGKGSTFWFELEIVK